MGHLRANGFSAVTKDLEPAELAALKTRYGIGHELSSCHTAKVGGYVIEGHVPAEDILRLLEERLEIAGLAVPGMPIGSPGMEDPSGRRDPYSVLAFDSEGITAVYARH